MPKIVTHLPRVDTPVDATPIKNDADEKKVTTGGVTGLDAATTAHGAPSSGVTRNDPVLTDLGVNDASLNDGARGLFNAAGSVGTPPATGVQEPSIQKLYDDPAFQELYGFVMGELRAVQEQNRGWDKLGMIRNFARAVKFVKKGEALNGPKPSGEPLFSRFGGTQERRAMAHLLMLLMPESDRTEAAVWPDGGRSARQSLFNPFPDPVVARADSGFQLQAGDVPQIAPIFTQHLTSPDLIDQIFRPGQNGTFLASKEFCPGAFLQDRTDINPSSLDKKQQVGHEGDPIFVKVDDVVIKDGKKYARCHVEAQHKYWLGDGGCIVQGNQVFGGTDVVLDKQGQPVLGPDGKPQPILIPVDHLADYLLDPGRNHRGLDLNREEDRCIALAFTSELKQTFHTDANGVTKSLFDWLEQADQRTPPGDLEAIKWRIREAAWQSIAKHACHPRRTHFKLVVGPKHDWQHEAYDLLNGTGIMQDCGNRYEKDKSVEGVHEMAWTGAFLSRGFVGGSLDCYGLAQAYDKLAATFLAPLGIISKTDLAEGHGSELNRVLSIPDANGVVQAGIVMKSKLNEMIVGLDARISSGRGPAAQYMENWPGYLKITGASGHRYDFAQAQAQYAKLEQQYAGH